MCTTGTTPEIVGAMLLLVVLPLGAVPAAASWWAWRAPSRSRVLLAFVASAAALLFALWRLALAGAPAERPLLDAALRAFPALLAVASALWFAHYVRSQRRVRALALASAAASLALSLAVAAIFIASAADGCANPPPGVPTP